MFKLFHCFYLFLYLLFFFLLPFFSFFFLCSLRENARTLTLRILYFNIYIRKVNNFLSYFIFISDNNFRLYFSFNIWNVFSLTFDIYRLLESEPKLTVFVKILCIFILAALKILLSFLVLGTLITIYLCVTLFVFFFCKEQSRHFNSMG